MKELEAFCPPSSNAKFSDEKDLENSLRVYDGMKHNFEILVKFLASKFEKDEPVTKDKIKNLTYKSIRKFQVLKLTFVKIDKNFINDLYYKVLEFIRTNTSEYQINKKKEFDRAMVKERTRKIKKYYSEAKKNYNFYLKAEDEFKHQEKKVFRKMNSKLNSLRDINDNKQEIKKREKQRKEIMSMYSNKKNNENLNFLRPQKNNMDVIEMIRGKSMLMGAGSSINPVQVLKAKLKFQESTYKNLEEELYTEHERLELFKAKKNLAKSQVVTAIDKIIKYPDLLIHLGIKLQNCIMLNLRVGEKMRPFSIGGDFTKSEKQFLIDYAQVEFDYQNETQNISESLIKTSRPNYRTKVQRHTVFNLKFKKPKKVKKILINLGKFCLF